MVEGTFARVFKSGVRPVEIGRRLVREMDDRRSIGVNGHPVAPNAFAVRLSPEDHEQMAGIRESLVRELSNAAREHARDEGYGFLGPITFDVQPDDINYLWLECLARNGIRRVLDSEAGDPCQP